MTGGGLLLVDIDRFRGPLDLLLHLVRSQDMDIFDIPIHRIAAQFLRAVEALQESGVDEAGEFLELAVALVHIKAKMLLPNRQGEDDAEDPRAELVRRLLEYEIVREVATRLRSAEHDRSRRFGKGYVEPRRAPAISDVALQVSWDQLFCAALGVDAPGIGDHVHTVATRTVAMGEKVDLILETVGRVEQVSFASLVAPWKERMHEVMTLLAGLELGRRRVVSLRQSAHFASLWFRARIRGAHDDGSARDDAGRARGSG